MEDVFDLREFVIVILRRWRLILIMAVIFGLLGGAYKIVPGFTSLSSQVAEEEMTSYNLSLAAYEEQKLALENELSALTASLDDTNQYLESSVLMQVNPYSKQVSSFSFYVNSGYEIDPALSYQSPDYTGRLVLAYAQAMQAGEMYEYIMERNDYFSELRYLQETVQVSYNCDGGIVTVDVTGTNQEMSQKVLALCEEYVMQKQFELSDAVAPHSISIINEASYTIVDMDLETQQREKISAISQINASIQEKTAAATNLKPPALPTSSKGNIVKSGIKFFVFGAVGGAALAVLLAFFLDMMDTKVRSERELRRRLKVPVFGTISRKN